MASLNAQVASSLVLFLLLIGHTTTVHAAFINEEHITTNCRYGANSVNENSHLPPATTRKNLEMKKTKSGRALLQSDDVCYTVNQELCNECVEKARSKVWHDCLAYTNGRGSAFVPGICSVST